MPFFSNDADANMAGALVQLVPYLVVLLGVVMCVVGGIQFVYRLVKSIVPSDPGAAAGHDLA